MTQMQNSQCEVDEGYKIGKWFTGLIPCWVDAPSTLQAAHNHHGKNIVAIHLKDGGYRCCCIDDKEPITFSLPENTTLVEGWNNRKSSCDEKAEEKAKAYDEIRKKIEIRLGSNVADEIFSQFEMSEDERIRKELIYFLNTEIPQCEARDKYIYWLEKQGEKIIHNMSNNNDDDIDICDTCKEGLYCSQSNYVKSHCWRRG